MNGNSERRTGRPGSPLVAAGDVFPAALGDAETSAGVLGIAYVFCSLNRLFRTTVDSDLFLGFTTGVGFTAALNFTVELGFSVGFCLPVELSLTAGLGSTTGLGLAAGFGLSSWLDFITGPGFIVEVFCKVHFWFVATCLKVDEHIAGTVLVDRKLLDCPLKGADLQTRFFDGLLMDGWLAPLELTSL